MKVKIGRDKRAASGDPVSNRAGASGWRSNVSKEQTERTQSPHVGTRKMVTYA